jgi:hypothetical protein
MPNTGCVLLNGWAINLNNSALAGADPAKKERPQVSVAVEKSTSSLPSPEGEGFVEIFRGVPIIYKREIIFGAVIACCRLYR